MSAQPDVLNKVVALDGVLKCILAFVLKPTNNTANDPIFEVWGDDDHIGNIRKVSKKNSRHVWTTLAYYTLAMRLVLLKLVHQPLLVNCGY